MGCGALFDLVTCRQTTFDFLLAPIQILPMSEGFSSRKERNAHNNRQKTSEGNVGTRFRASDHPGQALRLYPPEKFVHAHHVNDVTHRAERSGLTSLARKVVGQYKSR